MKEGLKLPLKWGLQVLNCWFRWALTLDCSPSALMASQWRCPSLILAAQRGLCTAEKRTTSLHKHLSDINIILLHFYLQNFRYQRLTTIKFHCHKKCPVPKRDGKNYKVIMLQRHTLVVILPHCLYTPSGCRWCLWVWWLCFSWRSSTWSWNFQSTGGCGEGEGGGFTQAELREESRSRNQHNTSIHCYWCRRCGDSCRHRTSGVNEEGELKPDWIKGPPVVTTKQEHRRL